MFESLHLKMVNRWNKQNVQDDLYKIWATCYLWCVAVMSSIEKPVEGAAYDLRNFFHQKMT